jgi:hypothetical protein
MGRTNKTFSARGGLFLHVCKNVKFFTKVHKNTAGNVWIDNHQNQYKNETKCKKSYICKNFGYSSIFAIL